MAGAVFRFITRRANGRESARLVEAEGESFTIGRGASCDLQLTDLRIALLHAHVSFLGPDAVAVEAEGAHSVQSGGRRTRRVELSLDRPRAIEIAPYRLTFQADDTVPGRLRVDVERAEAPLPKMSTEESEAVFTLRKSGLSKRGAAYLLIALVVAVFLAFPLWTFGHKAAPSGAQAIGTRTIDPHAMTPQTPGMTQASLKAGQMWSPGPLSNAHAFLAKDCKSCHTAALVSVKDETCLHCHQGLQQHADPHLMLASMPRASLGQQTTRAVAARFDRPQGRCASCHMEHMGQAGIMLDKPALCSDCHARIEQRLGARATIGDASDFLDQHPQFRPTVVAEPRDSRPLLTRQWTQPELDNARRLRQQLIGFDPTHCDGFSIGKPNFRGLVHLTDRRDVPAAALEGDNTGLVFPHALHMAAKGCVATMARQLGVRTDAAGALGCANCHTADPSGKGFTPVEMQRNCSVCHSLVFDNFQGVDRTLPHGQPRLVIATMLDFYKAAATDTARGVNADPRRLPGQAAMDRSAALRATAFTQADSRAADRVRAIFSPGGSCYGCHQIVPPKTGLDYDVAPVVLQQHFLPRAQFDHKAHMTAGMSCEQCHAARSSQSAADVLMPDISTCRTCHAGARATATASVPSPCVECHSFHAVDPSAPQMKPRSLRAAAARPPAPAKAPPPGPIGKLALAAGGAPPP